MTSKRFTWKFRKFMENFRSRFAQCYSQCGRVITLDFTPFLFLTLFPFPRPLFLLVIDNCRKMGVPRCASTSAGDRSTSPIRSASTTASITRSKWCASPPTPPWSSTTTKWWTWLAARSSASSTRRARLKSAGSSTRPTASGSSSVPLAEKYWDSNSTTCKLSNNLGLGRSAILQM